MSLIQPKPYMDRLRLRNHAVGTERRRNMSKLILENQTYFPLPVEYVDIDKAFFKWVEEKLDISYNGKKLPTYKLFSNQKLSEYSQTWENLDETGNIIMNFKTITRENNPQHGESQGGNYNVPGKRDYPMFFVPVLQENGEEAYDLYSMKQPLSVNFMYTVSVICNKYEILNKFNELMHYEFSSLECYISPNNHPMPMVIENITDESEYSINDRKYYAQSYQIKLMAYIIRKEDFKVTKIPSRFKIKIEPKSKKERYKTPCNIDYLNINNLLDKQIEEINVINEPTKLKGTKSIPVDYCDISESVELPINKKPSVVLEEIINECLPKEEDPYIHKKIKIFVDFPICEYREIEFTVDNVVDIESIETVNVKSFAFKINGVEQDFEDSVTLNKGDIIYISIIRNDEYKSSSMTIIGTDPEEVIDTRIDYESQLDAPIREEDIYVKKE